MDQHADQGPFSFHETAQFLRDRFPNSDDVEELLTRIEETIADAKGQMPRPNDVVALCNCHKPTIIAAIRRWFTEIRRNSAGDYERFARIIVSSGDSLITFNYDVSLEAQLKREGKWRLGDGYGFRIEGFEDHSPVRTLKLHGSVNWRFPVGSNGRPLIDSSEIAFLGFPGLSDPLYQRPIPDALGTMILPARCKQFFVETSLGPLHAQFWDGLWSQAAQALKQSTEVIICGYSLPDYDERAREMLLNENYSARIEICCGKDTDRIVEQMRNAGRNAHAAKETHFDGWLSQRLS
ncbi:MAG TPA: hypothetical protein VGG45_13515 [Terracidiphilus sp.]